MNDDHQLLSWVPRLRRYSRALVNNRDDADDLVQDTLERAWAKSGLWGSVADMRAWLFSIMHNLHVDGVRRPRLHTVTMDDDTPEVPVAATFGVGGVVGYRVSGGLYDLLGGHQLFAVAAVMALLPAVVLGLTPHRPPGISGG